MQDLGSPPVADVIVVDRVRATRLENRHRVVAVAVRKGDDGVAETVATWGDADRMTHARSSIKLFQALPLIESGAADAFGLGAPELALACASHEGEPAHLEALRTWLQRIDADVADLECGVQPGRDGTPLGNCCSGKHVGFLTVARHLGLDPAGYLHVDHPIQQRVRDAVGRALGLELSPGPDTAIDGCGIPIHPVPLRSLARGAAGVAAAISSVRDVSSSGADPSTPTTTPTAPVASATPAAPVAPVDPAALARLATATVAEPFLVGGTGSVVTELLRAGGGELVVKNGADGVQLAMAPGHRLGVAVKCLDGADAAADTALGHVLAHLGVLDDLPAVRDVFARRRQLVNHAGVPVADLVVTVTPEV